VNVDPNRLRNYGLSIQRVVAAVRGGNSEAGGRLIVRDLRQMTCLDVTIKP
jgi:Cu/Ag efflux pump CusA